MKPLAVHHVSLNVADVDDAVDFYVDTLGLSLRQDRPDLRVAGAWLDAGDQQVHLIKGDPPLRLGQHFALLVGDLDEAITDLRAHGVGVSDAASIGTSRQAFLHDPAGNTIELHQAG